MTDDDDTPRTRLLRQRQACDDGIAAAERGLSEELLAHYADAYRNRQVWWLICRDAVDRALTALEGET